MVFAATQGMLYWTCNSAAAIRGARPLALLAAPAGARAALVSTVLRLPRGERPRGIDFDPCEARLYWTNWNESHPCIQRAYTSGRGLQTVVATDILMPNGLALDHQAKKIYWADARLDKIERMHYDGSHRHVSIIYYLHAHSTHYPIIYIMQDIKSLRFRFCGNRYLRWLKLVINMICIFMRLGNRW